jgi:NAD(P)-dependent dehydrogenase (short-subunit alcohol dehydrogenase family)
MDGLLEDKTAVVTGAASGIGRAIAHLFAEQRADVVVADVREDPREDGATTHERINEETDAQALFAPYDVSDPAAVEATVETAVDEFGDIDVMVNNTGIVDPNGQVTDIDPTEYQRLLDVNLNGAFFGSQAAARYMQESDGGSIVNVSSIAGIQGYSDLAPYCVSKGGIRLLTYSLAAELGGDGIRVNAIHPGVIETAMTTGDVPIVGTETGEQMPQSIPLGRFGTPNDVAKTALYLASDLASYMTAESVIVDGGLVNTA